MKVVIFILLCISLLACKGGCKETASTGDTVTNSLSATAKPTSRPYVREVTYYYDSTTVGKKEQNKVVIEQKPEGDVHSAYTVTLYSKKGMHDWDLTQTLHFESDYPGNCNMEIPDINNDGLGDVSFLYVQSARGSNEGRMFYVYDSKTCQLIPIKNSENYPNLRWNEEAGCIEASLFHGTFSHQLLKLEADSLRVFMEAGVIRGETEDDLYQEITYIDRKGKSQMVGKKKISIDDMYMGLEDNKLIQKYRDR